MSNRIIPVFLLVAGLCLSWTQPVSFAREEQPQADADRFRDELVEFFADLGQYSPTVLGELSDESQSLEAIREKVEQLTPEELASLQRVFSQVPDWKMVPEALAASIPAETRQGLRSAADQVTDQVVELRNLRSDLDRVYTLARLLPPETLARLNLDQTSVAATQDNLKQLSPQRLGLLRQRLGANDGWESIRTMVPESLPPEIRQGSLALAQKGALDAAEAQELAELRQELDTFLADAELLPEPIRQRLDLTGVVALRSKLEASTPEMLFVLREEIDSVELRRTMRQVGMLAGLESGDGAMRAELQEFRGTLESVLAVPTESAHGVENVGVLRSWASTRTDAELVLVRQRIESVPDWRNTMPAVLEAAASPGVTWMVESLRQGTVDAAMVEDLLSFREQLSGRFQDLQSGGLVDAERAGAALRSLEQTDLIRLAVMRNAYFRQSQDGASPVSDGMLVDLQAAVDTLAPEIFVASGMLIPGDCNIPSVGSIGGQCIGIPFCDFCPEVCFPELTLPGLDLGVVCDAFAPLEAAIDTAGATVNAIGDVIDGIFNTVTDLATTVASLADPVVQGVIDALGAIIDATGLSDYLDPANLANLLGITGNFWDSIPVVPTLPCPADGTTIPLFGEVGESETAIRYFRYKWILDKLLEFIPNSEEAIQFNIPAYVLYSGAEYLGICLETAAELRDHIATNEFRAIVEADLVTLVDSLVAINSDTGLLQSSVNAYGAATNSGLAGLDSGVDSARATAAQIAAALTSLQAGLLDEIAVVEDAAVRQRIETSLLKGGDDRVSTFQLPSAFGGLLEVVRQVVLETIQSASDAGFNVVPAEAQFALADTAVAASDYRTAYERFRLAYRQATRGIEPLVLEQFLGDLDGNGEEELIVDFGDGPGLGIYIYWNSTSWIRLHGRSPEQMVVGDLDGNGLDELVIDFGTGGGLGLYVYLNNTNFIRLNSLSPEGLYVGDLDGSGADDLIVDFGTGPGLGLYVYYNRTSFIRRHGLSPLDVFTGDLDGNGLDEMIVDFGPAGLYAYYNNSGWVRLFGLKSSMFASDDLDAASMTDRLAEAMQEALSNPDLDTTGPPDPYPEDAGRTSPPEPRPEELGRFAPPEPVFPEAARSDLEAR